MQTTETKVSADTLWENYLNDKSIENKNNLLTHYLYLVRKVVLRMMPAYRSHSDYDDLLSSGVLGLMDAVNKFDSLRNVKFESYAVLRIKGEILDYLRKQDWVSNSMRQKIKKVRAVFDELALKKGREVTATEVAKELGWSLKQVQDTLDDEYSHNIIYFENAVTSNISEDTFKLIDTVKDNAVDSSPEQSLDKKEMLVALTQVLDTLPQQERTVIELYYTEELLLKEIAQVLNVTESRVSQIHSKALKRIRVALEKDI